MMVFTVVAALLAAITLAALLAPALRRPAGDEQQTVWRTRLAAIDEELASGRLSKTAHASARSALANDMLAALCSGAPVRRLPLAAAIGLGIGIPTAAIALYLVIGNPSAITLASAPSAGKGDAVAQRPDAEQIDAMVAKLERRLETSPGDTDGWIMLGRTKGALGRWPEAVTAYERAVALAPRDAGLLADYANALGMAQGQRLAGKPRELALKAIEIDPNNPKALALAGSAAFELQDFRSAEKYLERALAQLPAQSEAARATEESLREVRSHLGSRSASPSSASAATSKATGPTVSGKVSLRADLAAKVAPDDTVFVFARAVQGPRIPLAVARYRARDLPVSFTLDESMTMSPGSTLANADEVIVGARISKSANATAQSGDLEGLSPPVKVGGAPVQLVIDRVVP